MAAKNFWQVGRPRMTLMAQWCVALTTFHFATYVTGTAPPQEGFMTTREVGTDKISRKFSQNDCLPINPRLESHLLAEGL